MYRSFFKRFFDVLISFSALVVSSPVIVVLMLLLALYNRGSVFFFQNRPGKGAKIFKLIKFKTMRDIKDVKGDLLPDFQRVTPLGNFVRKSSLDELPQLFNVLLGDMSLIGPRPLLIKYLPLYTPEQHRRHELRPGITGWAQVNGRNSISWAKKFEYDVFYVDNYSFLFDIKIIFLTLKKVFQREGVNVSSTQTMESFNGNN
ncbi:MAG: sugar transferase [Bacteroidetes bacterium]|nr:MAG: sugar transferase [Bacteroidota bacterium]